LTTGAGFDLGCTDAVVLVTDWSSLALPTDGVVATGRFGFFGVTAAADVSAPDFFLSAGAVVVDFAPPPLLPVSAVLSSPAALSLPFRLTSASSSSDDPEDWDDSVVVDDDWVSELEEDDEDEPVDDSEEDVFEDVLDEDDESDDELEESVSDGPAHATPGAVATTTPTPKATAKPPTRPMYLALPITTTSRTRNGS
jgi:hypothetical protein